LWDDASPWDWDGGLYDLVCQLNGREQYPKLPSDIAKITVEATTKHLASLKDQLITAGLQKQYNQNYCGNSLSSARVIAPFDFSELELGQLLGNGGFSSVSEIARIRPQSRSSRRLFNPLEEKSRNYITNNIFCKIERTDGCTPKTKKLLDSTSTKSQKTSNNRPGLYCTQYAVKHLRNRLVTRTPEKFKRAAIDLVLEGQLLLFLDHPNIVSLHGWCGDGPKAFASGDPRGFFLILDKLPVTLEGRIAEWRTELLKYQRQLKRQEVVQERRQVVSNWARKALRRNQVDGTMSTTPTKAALGMQDLLLERLKVVHKIGLAVQYMHSKRLIHRDLKVSNVGFDVHGEVKLFDFGLSRLLPTSSNYHVNSARSDTLDCCESNTVSTGAMSEIYVMSRVGTKFYMAPEVRRKEPYSLPADVYSFGVILWEVLALSTPREFYHYERDRVSKLSKEKGEKSSQEAADLSGLRTSQSWLPICPCWPVGIIELVSASMSSDPMDRPTMEHVLVVLQKHIDALSKHKLRETTIIVTTKDPAISSPRVDLSTVDLRFLDKREVGI
jgi:serine/threonine protein kinase